MQNPFNNLGEHHKESTEAGVRTSRTTRHGRITWAKKKTNWTATQKFKNLFSFFSEVFFYFHLEVNAEAHTARCLKSRVKFPQSRINWVPTSSVVLLKSLIEMLISFSSRTWQSYQKMVRLRLRLRYYCS